MECMYDLLHDRISHQSAFSSLFACVTLQSAVLLYINGSMHCFDAVSDRLRDKYLCLCVAAECFSMRRRAVDCRTQHKQIYISLMSDWQVDRKSVGTRQSFSSAESCQRSVRKMQHLLLHTYTLILPLIISSHHRDQPLLQLHVSQTHTPHKHHVETEVPCYYTFRSEMCA